MRIDGEDYRHRGLPAAPRPLQRREVADARYATAGASLDDFPPCCATWPGCTPAATAR